MDSQLPDDVQDQGNRVHDDLDEKENEKDDEKEEEEEKKENENVQEQGNKREDNMEEDAQQQADHISVDKQEASHCKTCRARLFGGYSMNAWREYDEKKRLQTLGLWRVAKKRRYEADGSAGSGSSGSVWGASSKQEERCQHEDSTNRMMVAELMWYQSSQSGD